MLCSRGLSPLLCTSDGLFISIFLLNGFTGLSIMLLDLVLFIGIACLELLIGVDVGFSLPVELTDPVVAFIGRSGNCVDFNTLR